ncbi:calcium channel protein [Modicella reniformis]|uniref:Calcium channel protein n=1 Tax=Modicella reniformis TaxID=1440133 RepID=A0A9P6IUK7_9FUNG|nr:calcium channel protein [Modicella reniformis]
MSGRHGAESSSKAAPVTASESEPTSAEEKRSLDPRLDLQGLQQALSRIDRAEVHERRKVYNLVYKEALATCTARGISFHSILNILSFTIVDTTQALGMDEFLKRNERVKEIRAAVARETIHNLLLTIIARRNFVKQRRAKQNSRQRPEVPRIVIDTSIGNERGFRPDTSPMLTSSPSGRSSLSPSPKLDFSKGHSNYLLDDDISPLGGGFSLNPRLSVGSNDSNGWDFYEYAKMMGFIDTEGRHWPKR